MKTKETRIMKITIEKNMEASVASTERDARVITSALEARVAHMLVEGRLTSMATRKEWQIQS